MKFIVCPHVSVELTIDLVRRVFAGCYSSRRYVELCQGLLLIFHENTPDKKKALALYEQLGNSNVSIYDYVMDQVSFGKDAMMTLKRKIEVSLNATFKRTCTQLYASRRLEDELVIMRHVVFKLFSSYGCVPLA